MHAYEARIKRLNSIDIKDGQFVLYWMQASHRTVNNLALEYAISKANSLNKPVVAFFGLKKDFTDANLRHYNFMFEGLSEVEESLKDFGIKLVVWDKSPEIGAAELSKNSCFAVVDKGYLRLQKQWYTYAATQMRCPLVQIEDNVVVPVAEASLKEEYSAATIRPKIEKKQQTFPVIYRSIKPNRQSLDLKVDSLSLKNLEQILSNIESAKFDRLAKTFTGGTSIAIKRLERFIKDQLPNYKEQRNDPSAFGTSDMSPYLHFGQISPLQIFQYVTMASAPISQKEAFLEELIIRRELAINYVNYNNSYDSFSGLPNWAKTTLVAHQNDPRDYIYDLEILENGQTHDIYWNAAQNEMRLTGKMHGYMRMYWGKKIIEWTKTPHDAFRIALYLNNKYELDGRDPNGYAGVAWCFGKHDRPWGNRPIFGMVRYMNSAGLQRKFDIDSYVEKIKRL